MFKSKPKDKPKDKAKDPKDSKSKDKNPGSNGPSSTTSQPANPPVSKPKLVFHCQQAHGSPTGVISEFTNVKELYQKIAECYDILPSQVNTVAMHLDVDIFISLCTTLSQQSNF